EVRCANQLLKPVLFGLGNRHQMLRRAGGMLLTGETLREQSLSSESQRGHKIINRLLKGGRASFGLNLPLGRSVMQNPLVEEPSALTVDPAQMQRSVGAPAETDDHS